jgi:pSer/pThr/pTyr-binding forkhead associated (FHA) protein
MFALEISFTDGVSQPEMILVRRPQALFGASDYSHVVLEDMASLGYQLRVVRDLGRKFRCKPIASSDNVQIPSLLEGVYEGDTSLDLGPVRLAITALDIDLLLKESEPPDRAGVRVLRHVCSSESPKFPSIVVPGVDPVVVSFSPDQPVYIGRSSQCEVRLDSSDVSAKHARMGYESGAFWVEDLGSTNGTFLDQQQISGRARVEVGQPVMLGREIAVLGVTSEDQIHTAASSSDIESRRAPVIEQNYPVLISVSEVARPARVVVPHGGSMTIGRDPGSDMWLGAPHISRQHLVAEMSKTGELSITDHSTNGTMHDSGRLAKGDVIRGGSTPRVFNFGGAITVGLCFDEEQESAFIATQGAPNTFSGVVGTQVIEEVPRDPGTQAFNFEPPTFDEGTGTGTMANAGALYKSLKFSRKLMILLVFVVVVMVLMIMVNLVTGLM